MIPFSASDIIKLLEQLPIWKAVVGMPKRIAELEKRVAAMEETAANRSSQAPGPSDCPICGTVMKVVSEQPDPDFDFAGYKTHGLKCPECGNTANRQYKPGEGYT